MSHETKRFPTHGVAHDGQPWVLVPALVVFAQQIEAVRPVNHPTDGTVAGAAHDKGSPTSDHTVWPRSGSGRVFAIDVGNSNGIVPVVWEALRKSKDPRIMYAIHNGRMFSSYAAHGYKPWTWRPYNGSNPHKTHGHLSVQNYMSTGRLSVADTNRLVNDRTLWKIGVGNMLRVIDLQKALNKAGVTDYQGKKLVEDDVYGTRTESAWVKSMQGGSSLTIQQVREEVSKAKIGY